MIFDNDQYLFHYEPLNLFNENYKNSSRYRSYKSFLENIEEELAYKLYEEYAKSKKNIKLIKVSYDSNVAPIKDKIDSILLRLKNLSILFKNNSRYEITEKGFFVNKKYIDLIWSSQNAKSKFLNDFKTLLKLIKEINENTYKQKFFRKYKFKISFHDKIEHINLFEFKDDLINFVTSCMNIYSELFYDDFEYYYIKGAGSSGTARVFWNDLDSIDSFFHFKIPSEKYTTDLEDKQTEFEKQILPFLEHRLGKFEREKQATSVYSYVYILSNESYPNIYKIGSTSGTPRDRAAELSSTGVLHPFKVSFQIQLKNAEYYELKIHKILDSYRVKNNREFFQMELNEIKKILKQVSAITERGERKLSLTDLEKKLK